MPISEQGDGRDHNPYGFLVWMAGGGVNGGRSIAEAHAIGLRTEVAPHPVKDLHVTILTALGLHPEELSFEHDGRPERLTSAAGSARAFRGVLWRLARPAPRGKGTSRCERPDSG